jgi:hypothetical protein
VSRWARPARPWAPMFAGALIVVLWWLVAHNAGSGWVQVLGDLVFGVLLVGIVGPFVVVTRAHVRVRSAPGDGTAGLPVSVHVESRRRLRVRPVDPPGPDVFVGPGGRRHAADDLVTVVPARRGLHGSRDARHRLGRSVRVAMVDQARVASASDGAARRTAVWCGDNRFPCAPTTGPARR